MSSRVPIPDSLPEPIELRLLPYWSAVKQARSVVDLPPPYLWLYIETCQAQVNGKVVADLMEALPYHVILKMQRNFGVAA